MPPEKFYGRFYGQVKPDYGLALNKSNKLLFKGLASLPRPTVIQDQQLSDMPFTDKMIGLEDISEATIPKGKHLCAVVIDSGVYESKFLKDSILMRLSAVNGDKDVDDKYGHGTHMAGIIASNKRLSGMGIAPDATIISIKVTRSISGEANWTSIARALSMAYDLSEAPNDPDLKKNRISVVNLSFNSLDCMTASPSRDTQGIYRLFAALRDKNIPVVVSAGNLYEKLKGLKSGMGYPAGSPLTINVGASMNFNFDNMNEGSLATFSERKLSGMEEYVPDYKIQQVSKNFLLAPGGCSVSLSNDPKHPFSFMSGTSSAAAVVSGCILLLQDAYIKKHGTLPTVDQIRDLLTLGSIPTVNAPPASGPRAIGPPPAPGGRVRGDTKFYDNKMYCGINVMNSLSLV